MASRVERTVRAQREFVANASHQLRTPLTGIKLRLEAGIAESDDEEVRTQLRAADREVERLSQIIERLLTMASQIEEGTVPHADLGDAVERAVHRWRERAARGATQVSKQVDAADLAVAADPADVDQVLDVLIDNALTHAAGPIRVIASAGPGRAIVSVADRGPGIPEDELARVTERFFRGRGAATGGSGLGLAIARELAERWGGALDLRAEDEGTRVDVWFPVSPDRALVGP
jgi:signal transduction histidine kinase